MNRCAEEILKVMFNIYFAIFSFILARFSNWLPQHYNDVVFAFGESDEYRYELEIIILKKLFIN